MDDLSEAMRSARIGRYLDSLDPERGERSRRGEWPRCPMCRLAMIRAADGVSPQGMRVTRLQCPGSCSLPDWLYQP